MKERPDLGISGAIINVQDELDAEARNMENLSDLLESASLGASATGIDSDTCANSLASAAQTIKDYAERIRQRNSELSEIRNKYCSGEKTAS